MMEEILVLSLKYCHHDINVNVAIKGGTEVFLCGEETSYTHSALDNDGLL